MDFKVICPVCDRIDELELEVFTHLVEINEVEVVDSPNVDGIKFCEWDQEFKPSFV